MEKFVVQSVKVLAALVVLIGLDRFPLLAQTKQKVEKKVMIIKEYTDENGQKKVETIVKEGEDVSDAEIQKLLKEKNMDMPEFREKEIITQGGPNGDKKDHKYRFFNRFDDNDRGHKGMDFDWNQNGQKPRLGVNLSPEGEKKQGAVVQSVIENSPAEKAGLHKGDIITKINQTAILNNDALIAKIASSSLDETISITYLRDGKSQEVKAKLTSSEPNDFGQFDFNMGDMPHRFMEMFPKDGFGIGAMRGFGGVKLDVQVEEREDRSGVEVKSVDENGIGAKAGLKFGDLITHIAGDRIDDIDDLQDALKENSGQEKVNTTVIRNGSTTTLSLNLKKEEPKPQRKTIKL
jgi:C-terminal processing protease CtpA/Prc